MKYFLNSTLKIKLNFKKIIFLLLFLVSLFRITGEEGITPLATDRLHVSGYVALMEINLEIIVTYQGNKKDWAEYILERAIQYLPVIEKYLNAPLPYQIQDNTLYIQGEDSPEYNGNYAGGFNANNYIVLDYDVVPLGQPATLLHELNHFWFGPYPKWFREGVNNFIPVALEMGNYFPFDFNIKAALDRQYFYNYNPEFDIPVYNYHLLGLTGEEYLICHQKNLKIQYLIYQELGMYNYRLFLQGLLRFGPVKEDQALMEILSEYKEIDWTSFFSGWIFPGAYQNINISDFVDIDSDGIISVDEIYYGTDPDNPDSDGDLIPDGAELELHLNPLFKDSMETVIENGPYIDGLLYDWEYYTYNTISDPEGDSSIGQFDITYVHYFVRNNTLYIAFNTKESIDKFDRYRIYFYFDINLDVYSDLYFPVDRKIQTIINMYNFNTEIWYNTLKVKCVIQDTVEISIPLDDIGVQSFQFYIIIKDYVAGSILDSSERVRVDID